MTRGLDKYKNWALAPLVKFIWYYYGLDVFADWKIDVQQCYSQGMFSMNISQVFYSDQY